VGPDEPWNVGSIGKSICTSVIGALVEQGKLKWDTTLGDLVPELLTKQPGYAIVTIEQIMRNRSGFASDAGITPAGVQRLTGTATTPTAVRANYARHLLAKPSQSLPGVRFAYSNGGYAVLAYLAEKASGQSYEALVDTLVFKPLSLTHSFVGSAAWPP